MKRFHCLQSLDRSAQLMVVVVSEHEPALVLIRTDSTMHEKEMELEAAAEYMAGLLDKGWQRVY